MNFWNTSVLGLTFFTPVAAILLTLLRRERDSRAELRIFPILLTLSLVVAAVAVAHFERPIKLEFLWPLTLEQSGYFEFSLQLLWSRFGWIFFTAAMLLGFMAYDANSALGNSQRRAPLLFLMGSFLFSVLAFLSENTLLSLMFVEISAFMLHAFGMQEEGERERASYFKRVCFIFLGLTGMFFIALSRQLSTGSVTLLGVVLYIVSMVVSKHSPTRWSQLPILFVHMAMALFLLERVLPEDAPVELAMPLAAIFAAGTLAFAAFSLLSPASLGAAFWLALSLLGYLLYLRFSSARPSDPFWGAYEVLGLGASYAMITLFRFGDRLDLFWKRAFAYVLLAIMLGLASGALPSVEITGARFDSETTIARVAVLGFLTFLVSLVSSKALTVSLHQEDEDSSPRPLLIYFAPAIFMLAVQAGVLARWSDLSIDTLAAGGFAKLFYDPRVLLTGATSFIGVLSGALIGSNSSFKNWIKVRGLRMEDMFPSIDPSILRWNLRIMTLPERGAEWISSRTNSLGASSARMLDSLDRVVFGDRLFQRLAEYGNSLSLFTRFFHSGQARAYLFLGVLITLISSLVFLLEGR